MSATVRGRVETREARARLFEDGPLPVLNLLGATAGQRRTMASVADDLVRLERATPEASARGWKRTEVLGRLPVGLRAVAVLVPVAVEGGGRAVRLAVDQRGRLMEVGDDGAAGGALSLAGALRAVRGGQD